MEYTVHGRQNGQTVQFHVEAATALAALDRAEELFPDASITDVYALPRHERPSRRRLRDRWARHH